MLSRREMVGKIAAGTAVVVCGAGVAKAAVGSLGSQAGAAAESVSKGEAAAGAPPAAQHPDLSPPETLSATAPWELIAPLAVGSPVANGWHVAGLTGAVDGSCVLTLRNDRGRAQRVHLCRNDGQPNGLVYTREIDLVVMNGGEGDLPTEEGLAQAIAEVAHVLAANERDRAQQPVITALLGHNERVRRFAGPEDRRLR